MANTYSQCFYHIVFSTKNRVKFISPEIEKRVWAYIGGILKNHNMTAIAIGGIDDHIHVLVLAKPSVAPSQIAQLIKGESSKWDSFRVSEGREVCVAGWVRRFHRQQIYCSEHRGLH